ncbi:3-hydroxyacyl-CoA dehydrogenase NAD-binding domain-containing protein [Sphingosinithalassobacter portus]|uniref:3-hydroxyacyl-CoA dehydrogenase NAD-binding domain-containing protein n=1 Tax=Stakelama portus TaxID=2676234 RepID=UPI001EFE2A72|nr:3-hydroxyacyl-CoA dehydrogenase NAD-binding domain-containing protein [Sphingosinithalassobacter portus]
MNDMSPPGAISSYSVRDGIAVLAINSPPVNALGFPVRKALDEGIRRAVADSAASALVIRCDGRTFFAGADIAEFGGELKLPGLNDIFAVIEGSPKPVIAAIHGTALGGGCELALACHYRCALRSAKLGLPEVSLGLLPGAGGTQRTPRIAGVAMALDLIVGGRPISAAKAETAGMVDRIVDGDLEAEAVAYARQLVTEKAPLRRIRDMSVDLDLEAAQAAITTYRVAHSRQFKGFKAPGHIVQAIEAAVTLPFDQGLAREWELFEELMASTESGAQRHLFFAERAAGKVPDIGRDVKPVDIGSVTVIGAGTMGSGIATAFLNIGLPVTLVDREQQAVERGAANIRKTIAGMVAKGRIAEDEGGRRSALLSTSVDLPGAVSGADLIVEAVFEDLELKKAVFAQIDAAAKADAILASNTSFLDLDAIAAATSRPEQVVGLHFFVPANVMRLLEVVRGEKTSDVVVATGMALGRKLGKVAILSRVCDGFIANRAMAPRQAAADALILEGPLPWEVDRAMVEYGFPMGPFQMVDIVGVDVIGWDRENSAGRTVQEVLCEMGRWGQKKNGGYYDYDEERRAQPSPVAEKIVREMAAKTGADQHRFREPEIVERLLYPVVNEGAKILEEGVALRASDIDVALVTGYGWPVWTGGPMFWADSIGLPAIVAALDATIGADAVSPLLRKLAAEGGSLT